MRRAFFETLASIAAADPRVVLLTADLGYMAIEEFSERCPRQFFNAGVSEQNMIGMATGLAEAGFVPFVYSIAPFVVLRAYEFIRNGPVAHRSAVRLVSVGAGFDYGTNGISHYGIDDIGVLRVQPGLMLLTPADTPQARAALLCTWSLPGPLYFRLSKRDTVLPGLEARFALGHTQTLRSGTDVLLVGLGTAAQETLDAAEQSCQRRYFSGGGTGRSSERPAARWFRGKARPVPNDCHRGSALCEWRAGLDDLRAGGRTRVALRRPALRDRFRARWIQWKPDLFASKVRY